MPPALVGMGKEVFFFVKLEQKKQIVEALKDRFEKSKVVIVTDYKGLDVAAINDLRKKLKEAGIEYRVAKNTLFIRAAEDTQIALMKEHFKGPNAVALGYDDPVAPAKILTAFSEQDKKLEIKGGVLEGKVISIPEIKALAALPGKEVLLAQLLGVLDGVPTALARALNDVPVRLLNVLNALRSQKEAAA
jgi:large subunit ribosomal protein L10